ncbi:MAG: GTPase HflX [Desulfurococcaceae archaeon]
MDNVAVVIPSRYKPYLEEELSLVKTVYNNIETILFIKKPNAKYYVSLDKINYLKNNDSDKIIVMDRVKPSQIINLMRETGKEVIDRVMLILEIFEMHAGSLEAKLQIELVRLKYYLPLVKESIRFAKLGELHGYLGAGRYGYEKYYTMLKKREAAIRRKLEELRRIRDIRRSKRRELGYPHLVLIGYTSAGKTTIFNLLTGLCKPVGPEPFTTITPKSSRISINGVEAILTDTVGFIRELPHEIVEAFYVTLEEVSLADGLIHVIDASKNSREIINTIYESHKILSKIGVHNKPMLYVLNKIDLISDYLEIKRTLEDSLGIPGNNIVAISALKMTNIDLFLESLKDMIGGLKHGENLRTEIRT